MNVSEGRTSHKVSSSASERQWLRPATFVPYRVFANGGIPDETTPLMCCEATDKVRQIAAALSDVAALIDRFGQRHGAEHGACNNCDCVFCMTCPHVNDILHTTYETLQLHMWLLDNARPPTADELKELRLIDALYLEGKQPDASAVVEVR